MRTHNQAGEFAPNILGGLIGGRRRYRLADDDVVQLQQIFQLLDREQGLAFVCTQRTDELLVAFQCRQHACTDHQHRRAYTAAGTHSLAGGFDVCQRVRVFIAPFLGGGQVFAETGLISRFVLQECGSFDFLTQLHALDRTACCLGALVVHGFSLFAVIHAGGQIMLFQHDRHKAWRVQRNHIRCRADRTFGLILDKRTLAEHRHTHAFFFSKHYREDFLGNEIRLLVAQCEIGQNRIKLAAQAAQMRCTHVLSFFRSNATTSSHLTG